jgi:hypothetical protein
MSIWVNVCVYVYMCCVCMCVCVCGVRMCVCPGRESDTNIKSVSVSFAQHRTAPESWLLRSAVFYFHYLFLSRVFL